MSRKKNYEEEYEDYSEDYNENEDPEEAEEGVSRIRKAKRRKHRKIRRILLLLLEVMLLGVLAMGFFIISKWDKIQHVNIYKVTDAEGNVIATIKDEDLKNPEIDKSVIEVMNKGSINFAVFGVDATDNRRLVSEANTDVIMIFNVNLDTGDIRIASVYRDTYMYMPTNSTFNKVNYAAMRWDTTQTLSALNYNLDLALTDYVVVNWKCVADAINMLGGVDDVEITPEMLNYINGYITSVVEATGVGSVQIQNPGVQHLDGVQAVAYCRVRYIDSDLGRTGRQREIVSKMLQKAKTASPSTLMAIADTLLGEVATTFEVSEVMELCQTIPKLKLTSTTGYPYYLYTNEYVGSIPHDWPIVPMSHELNVSQLHEFLFDQKNYQCTPMVHDISERLSSMSGIGAPAETTPVNRY